MGIDVHMSWKGMTGPERAGQITGFSTAHGHVGYLREAYHGSPYMTHVLVPEAFDAEAHPEDEWTWECDECLGTGANEHAPESAKEHYGRSVWKDEHKCEACDGYGATKYEGAPIPAARMAARLPRAVTAALVREAEVYGNAEARAALAEQGQEPALHTGGHPGELELDEESPDSFLQAISGALGEARKLADGEEEFPFEVPEGLQWPSPEELEAWRDGEVWKAPAVEQVRDRYRELGEQFVVVRSALHFVQLAFEKEQETGEPVRVYASY